MNDILNTALDSALTLANEKKHVCCNAISLMNKLPYGKTKQRHAKRVFKNLNSIRKLIFKLEKVKKSNAS